ncbi:hypothetical protein BaRGS_00008652 [Batillaria attramentaria]|uniref:Uncharacterized protein n=1 Tax=Batillaria attramentaria TaxID=370345 RepID=A0ABD0LKT7_9CAEN
MIQIYKARLIAQNGLTVLSYLRRDLGTPAKKDKRRHLSVATCLVDPFLCIVRIVPTEGVDRGGIKQHVCRFKVRSYNADETQCLSDLATA